MKYHTLFFSKIRKDVAKFDVCCSGDWRFKGNNVFSCEGITLYLTKCQHMGSTWDLGTYRNCEQPDLSNPDAQAGQSLCYSHTQNIWKIM